MLACPPSAVRPRDVGSVLKLVNLALARMPSMFAANNRSVLLEVGGEKAFLAG